MIDILALLQCLCPHLNVTTIRQLRHIILAMLTMTGRVTMLGLSRWAGRGGSYRTVQRFYYKVISWPVLFWLAVRSYFPSKLRIEVLSRKFHLIK